MAALLVLPVLICVYIAGTVSFQDMNTQMKRSNMYTTAEDHRYANLTVITTVSVTTLFECIVECSEEQIVCYYANYDATLQLCNIGVVRPSDTEPLANVGFTAITQLNQVIRLGGSVTVSPTKLSGRVEVYHDGVWGTVCHDRWDNDNAMVVCRQFGYSNGIATKDATFGEGSGQIWLDEVKCRGNENEIGQCPHNGWGDENCGHHKDAGVICYEGNALEESRLAGTVGNTSTTVFGRVEVMVGGIWGTVCYDRWDEPDAMVFCRQLGYYGGLAMEEAEYGEGSGIIWLDDVKCIGDEKDMSQCPHNGWGDENCGHSEDAGVMCKKENSTGPDSIHLVGSDGKPSTAAVYGRVEILYYGIMGTVCDDDWDDNDATVICRHFGYNGGIAVTRAGLGEGSGKIWLDDVNCRGDENKIDECSHIGWGIDGCSHREDAGVFCVFENQTSSTVLRLIGSTPGNRATSLFGTVEIVHNGRLGTICDSLWGNDDAKVVCHQFGYSDGLATKDAKFGAGSGQIWLDRVSCNGNEKDISECGHSGWGVKASYCDHNDDAGVYCKNGNVAESEDIRLGGSHGNTSMTVFGRVEVKNFGIWGTVCDYEWDNDDAKVVCRLLGYNGGIAVLGSVYGDSFGTVWLSTLKCNGDETEIGQCPHKGWGLSDCGGSDGIAGAICLVGTEMPPIGIRLAGSAGNTSETVFGRVEIQYFDLWGTVCHNSWDDNDAKVACRQLGYHGGIAKKYAFYGEGSRMIWLDRVSCTGNENDLSECPHREWGDNWCRHSQDAGVICTYVEGPV